MLQAIVAGALAGLLVGGAVGGAVKSVREKDVFTFGEPAAIVEQAEQREP